MNDIIQNTEHHAVPRDAAHDMKVALYLHRLADELMASQPKVTVRFETNQPEGVPAVAVLTVALRPGVTVDWETETAVPSRLFNL